jgi:hypothetical protein
MMMMMMMIMIMIIIVVIIKVIRNFVGNWEKDNIDFDPKCFTPPSPAGSFNLSEDVPRN